jgi:hypothetical protein
MRAAYAHCDAAIKQRLDRPLVLTLMLLCVSLCSFCLLTAQVHLPRSLCLRACCIRRAAVRTSAGSTSFVRDDTFVILRNGLLQCTHSSASDWIPPLNCFMPNRAAADEFALLGGSVTMKRQNWNLK